MGQDGRTGWDRIGQQKDRPGRLGQDRTSEVAGQQAGATAVERKTGWTRGSTAAAEGWVGGGCNMHDTKRPKQNPPSAAPESIVGGRRRPAHLPTCMPAGGNTFRRMGSKRRYVQQRSRVHGRRCPTSRPTNQLRVRVIATRNLQGANTSSVAVRDGRGCSSGLVLGW